MGGAVLCNVTFKRNVTAMTIAPVPGRPEVPLQVITPADTRASIRRARASLEQAAREIAWQVEMEGHRTLGYSSWGAMREAEYGAAAFMVPSRTHPGWQGMNAATEPDADDTEATAVTPTCSGCGQGMAGRADRRFCSSACRQRAYRRRTRSTGKG